MIKRVFASTLAAVVTLMPFAAGAQDVEASVSIDAVAPQECGQQDITFTGTAVFPQNIEHLEVKLDGTVVFVYENNTSDTLEAWSTDAISVSPGEHELVVTMYDHYNNNDKTGTGLLAGPEMSSFTVAECSGNDGGNGGSNDGDNNNGGGGDDGDGSDCCPGPDPVVPTPKPTVKPRVAGVSTTMGLSARLAPINGLFRSVFGRTPTYEEWAYWANRLLTDKPQYDALLGAMQWQHLHDKTMGD